MKTGLESLDTGAPEITYSGNQGPKSPQEDQQKMAEFELQEYMEEFERVFPDMKDKRGTPDYMKELQDYFEGLASKQSEGIGDMAMKSGLIDEYRNYKMGQEDAGKPVMSPREYYRSLEQDRMGVKEGGVMQLVKENEDGSRPGYRGPGGYQGGRNEADQATGGQGGLGGTGVDNRGGTGGGDNRREQYSVAQTQNIAPTTISSVDDRGTTEQNLNQARAVINAQLEPKGITDKTSNFVKNYIEARKKGIYNLFPNNPQMELGFLARLKTTNPEEYEDLPQDLKNLLEATQDPTANFTSYKEFPKFNYENFKALTDIGDKDFAKYAYERGSPGLLVSGDLGSLGDKYVKGKDPLTGETLYGYGSRTGGDGSPIILPTTTGMTADATGKDVDIADTDTTDFVSRFAPVTSLPFADYRGGIEVPAADGGRIGYAGGGITDLRQGYFLGKLVKKATRGIKKIVKSDIGKAALTAAALYYGPKMFKNKNFMGTLFGQAGSRVGQGSVPFMQGLLPKLGLTRGGGSLMPTAFGGIAALSALPLFMGQDEEEDDLDKITGQAARGPSLDIPAIRRQALAGNLDRSMFPFMNPSYYAADGGRIGLAAGGIGDLRGALSKEMFNLGEEDEDEIKKLALGGSAGLPPITMIPEGMDSMSFPDDESTGIAQATPTTTLPNQMPRPRPMMDPRMMQQMMMQQRMNPMMAQRGMMQQPRIMAQEGGMMDMGGMEKDYRNEGGFVPIGGQERADDVPARLSKNEFVFTADAVRNAGGGDIDKGAEIMENMMENLEAGGKVSEASQGLSGAREMFATQQRLGEVL